jgi:hypothetical protein
MLYKIIQNYIKSYILSQYGLVRRESAQKSLKQHIWTHFGHFLADFSDFSRFFFFLGNFR